MQAGYQNIGRDDFQDAEDATVTGNVVLTQLSQEAYAHYFSDDETPLSPIHASIDALREKLSLEAFLVESATVSASSSESGSLPESPRYVLLRALIEAVEGEDFIGVLACFERIIKSEPDTRDYFLKDNGNVRPIIANPSELKALCEQYGFLLRLEQLYKHTSTFSERLRNFSLYRKFKAIACSETLARQVDIAELSGYARDLLMEGVELVESKDFNRFFAWMKKLSCFEGLELIEYMGSDNFPYDERQFVDVLLTVLHDFEMISVSFDTVADDTIEACLSEIISDQVLREKCIVRLNTVHGAEDESEDVVDAVAEGELPEEDLYDDDLDRDTDERSSRCW